MDGYTAQYERIAPQAYFQMPNGDVCPINWYTGIVTVGNNTKLVDGVSGYIHRVIGWRLYTGAGGLSTFKFKSATGGAERLNLELPASSKDIAEMLPPGYWETVISQGIFVDIGTTAAYVNLAYITYKPAGT